MLKFIPRMRGRNGGRRFIKELDFQHWLVFCYLVIFFFQVLNFFWRDFYLVFSLMKSVLLQMLLTIGSLVSLSQQRNMSMMFSLLMDFQLRLFKFWFLV